ncbi:MAG: putative DNA binding domain-containing protein [Deltaproteobacteria bacterium]|nr:putative DNA binding domain-containing protein [Deltaproteobacteria bacterium]
MNPNIILKRLLTLAHENEWVEWKVNNSPPQEIGEYLSALANSAALHSKEAGYIVWGIHDQTREVIGTTFKPHQEKVGNEELENWLITQLMPQVHFSIYECTFNDKNIVIFEVLPASHVPIRFKDMEYIRVGSYKKKLKDHPEKERELWNLFSHISFETGIARSHVTADDVLSLIDYAGYFDITKQTFPDGRTAILDRLTSENLIVKHSPDSFDITNLGALLFAKDLQKFDRLARKALRVVIYKSDNRVNTVREQMGTKGYALGYEGAMQFINSQLPQNEHIGQALRREVRDYPEIAIRELVTNALIHQDFNMTGTGPMVEIFSDRIEITNPGEPLVDTMRFLDNPPRSRNEALAKFMRRLNICEERGSGIDKVFEAVELFQLPAPDFQEIGEHLRVVLFAPKTFREMDKSDRVRACYQHTALQWVSNNQMSNTSLRKRFGISDENASQASRIIKETTEAKLIKEYDPDSKSRKHARYVPFWA